MTEDPSVGPRTVIATGTAIGRATAVAYGRSRLSFAMTHVSSARRFARLLSDLETRFQGAGWGDHFDEARDYATAALILSFSAVEAAINEALDDLGIHGALYDVIEKASPIDKAEAVLVHLGKPPMDRGTNPIQSLNLLRQIRNFLVHARGEWSDANGTAAKLSKKIASAGIPLSPFADDPQWAAERGVLSAGAAAWAVSTASDFIAAYRDRAGLPALP